MNAQQRTQIQEPKTLEARTLVSREPWWAVPPKPGQDEMELGWGYLELYSDGHFAFNRTRPSDEEIRNRKSCRYI